MLKDEFQNQLLAILFASQEPVALAQLQETFPDTDAEALYWGTLAEVWWVEDYLAELTPTTPAGWEAVFGVVASMHAKDDIPAYIRWGKYPDRCSYYTGHIAAALVRRLAQAAPAVLGWPK